MISIQRCKTINAQLYGELLQLWDEAGISNPARSDSLESIRHSLDHNGWLILAYDAGVLCGCAWLTHDYRRLYIHHMAVAVARQDQGIGRQIMEASLQIAAELGYQPKLEVHGTNARALHLYRQFGFTELEGYLSMIRRPK